MVLSFCQGIGSKMGRLTPTCLPIFNAATHVSVSKSASSLSAFKLLKNKLCGLFRLNAFKTQLTQIKFIDKRVDHANEIVYSHKIIHAFG